MNRRRFLRRAGSTLGAGALAAALPRSLHAQPAPVSVSLLPETSGVLIPENFMGLGYEMSSVAPLGLLSPENTCYVRLIQNLGPRGVLRFGGIVADYTRYEPAGTIRNAPKNTVITRQSVEQVSAFLSTVGWKAIWSVNFGRGTLNDAVVEAREVAHILGDRLLAIELGNEVENYGSGVHPLRHPPYSFDDYHAEYMRWHEALVRAVPRLRFAAPDTAASVDWVERMAADAHGEVQWLTTHYYRNAQQFGSAQQLQQPDPALRSRLERLRTASQSSAIPWRMCETNSFSGGGLPGVSDTTLGALWTLDFMLLLAEYGCAGVNLETGVNQLGFVSSYSPIQDDGKHHNSAGAPYYGMLAFAAAVRRGQRIFPVALDGAPSSVTGYLLGEGARPRTLVLINRSDAAAAEVTVTIPGWSRLQVQHLRSAPGRASETIFAGTSVAADGTWRAGPATTGRGTGFQLPPMSAVVVSPATVS